MLEAALKVFGPVLAVMVFFSILSISQRNEEKTSSANIVLEYGWMLKCVPWLGFFVCFVIIGIPFVMYIHETSIESDFGNFIFYLMVWVSSLLLPVYLFVESYFVKFTIIGTTIFCESPWRKNRRIEVSDIIDVSFSQALKYYNLKTRDDGIIRVYMYMNGAPRFLDFLERQLGIKIERYY
jgi:hypothetical protein